MIYDIYKYVYIFLCNTIRPIFLFFGPEVNFIYISLKDKCPYGLSKKFRITIIFLKKQPLKIQFSLPIFSCNLNSFTRCILAIGSFRFKKHEGWSTNVKRLRTTLAKLSGYLDLDTAIAITVTRVWTLLCKKYCILWQISRQILDLSSIYIPSQISCECYFGHVTRFGGK